MLNTGMEANFSIDGPLTTPIYELGKKEPCEYSLEGSIGVAGSAFNSFRDGIGMISREKETKEIGWEVPDTGTLFLHLLAWLLRGVVKM